MSAPINLENSAFRLEQMIGTDWEPVIDLFHKGKWVRLKDFGSVLVGSLDPNNEFNRFVLDLDGAIQSPVFLVPGQWRMPQLLKALGAFSSTSEASKNGWNKDIEPGLSTFVVKINRILGAVTVFKATPGVNPNPAWTDNVSE